MMPRAEEILRTTSLARFVPPEHFERMRDRFEEVHCDFGETIIRQGRKPMHSSCSSPVVRESSRNSPTVRRSLNRLQPGHEFGESAPLAEQTRTTTVRCSTAVDVLRLGKGRTFQELVAEFPELLEFPGIVLPVAGPAQFLYTYSHFWPVVRPGAAPDRPSSARGVPAGRDDHPAGDPAGLMYIVREGRVRIFTGPRTRRSTSPLQRGDYWGVVGDDRAAAASRPRRLPIAGFLRSRRKASRSWTANSLRLKSSLPSDALYQAKVKTRVPLDFSQELLPAEADTSTTSTKAYPPSPAEDGAEEPFADERGFFLRSRSPTHPPHAHRPAN